MFVNRTTYRLCGIPLSTPGLNHCFSLNYSKSHYLWLYFPLSMCCGQPFIFPHLSLSLIPRPQLNRRAQYSLNLCPILTTCFQTLAAPHHHQAKSQVTLRSCFLRLYRCTRVDDYNWAFILYIVNIITALYAKLICCIDMLIF